MTGNSVDVLEEFLAARALSEADGRPLYAYRCDPAEFRHIEELLQGRLKPSGCGTATAQLFCLWGAEWWRRNHSGGRWKWEGMLAAIGAGSFAPGEPHYSELLRIVQRGLVAWDRPLLTVGQGRAFLVTLACEGGLPLRLVLQQQNRLRSYFRALLEEFRLFGQSEIPGRELAERVGDRLPKGLRQDVVYELSARLAEQIRALQHFVGDADRPVADLDERQPGWRDRLPLRLPDGVARTLLNNLLLDAADVARGGKAKLRWRRFLEPLRDGDWELKGELELPSTLVEQDFSRLFRLDDEAAVPKRFDLCTRGDDGGLHVLALGSRRGTSHNGTAISLEIAVEDPTFSRAPEDSQAIVARTVEALLSTDAFPGSGALSDLPWVFRDLDPNDPQPARLIGEGSVRLRETSCLVAVPEGSTMELADDAQAQEAGTISRLSRVVYQVSGTAAFLGENGSRTVVRTRSISPEGLVEYRPLGARVAFGRSKTEYFRGSPRLTRWCDGVYFGEVPQNSLQWEPDGFNDQLPFGSGVVGDGRLRFAEDGEARYSAHVRVLPEKASVGFVPSQDDTRGSIHLEEFWANAVSLVDCADVDWEIIRSPEARAVEVRMQSQGEPPSTVQIALRWKGRGQTVLRLPFPSDKTSFVLPDGRRLSSGERLSAEALAGVHAEAVVPSANSTFVLSGEYRGSDVLDVADTARRFFWPLQEVSKGYHSLDLAEVQGRVGALLSQGVDPDACVRLRLEGHSASARPTACTVDVHRFDLTLGKRQRSPLVIGLDDASLSRTSLEERGSLTAEAVPLLEPAAHSRGLDLLEPGAWSLPEEELPEGPYLIVARQNDWYRVRPMPWHVRHDNGLGSKLEHPVTLEEVYQAGPVDDDSQVFRSVLAEMVTDHGHRGWSILLHRLQLSKLLPVRTFPMLIAAADNPDVVACGALRIGASEFDLMWDKLESLPFLWELVPVASWRGSIESRADGLRGLMSEMPPDVADDLLTDTIQKAVSRVESRLPGLGPPLESALAVTFSRPPSRKATSIATPQILEALKAQRRVHMEACPALQQAPHEVPRVREGERIRRLLADDPCCRELLVPQMGKFSDENRAMFADLPLYTAAHVLQGNVLDGTQRRQVRAARNMDPDWFNEALRLSTLILYGCTKHRGIQKHLDD